MAKRKSSPAPNRRSSVDRLPPEVRDEIHRLCFAHGRTLDEIIAHLKEMGMPAPSRSALGRHLKHLSAEMKARLDYDLAQLTPAIAFTNALTDAIMAQFEEVAPEHMSGAIRHMLSSHVLNLSIAGTVNSEGEEKWGLKESLLAARTLSTLENARRTEEAAKKLAAEARKKTADDLKERAKDKSSGISDEVLQAATKFLLGEG